MGPRRPRQRLNDRSVKRRLPWARSIEEGGGVTSRAHVRAWERLAERDALGAVLTPFEGGDASPESLAAFWATGVADIEHVMALLGGLGCARSGGAVLDYGCGLGRLTAALAAHFDRAVGVDIAAPMLARATALSADPKVSFRQIERGEPIALPGEQFALVLSLITLQHLGRREIETTLRALAAVVAPHGVLHFNLPDDGTSTWRRSLQDRLPDALFYRLRPMKMRGLPREQVVALLRSSGLVIVDVRAEETGALRYTAVSSAGSSEAEACRQRT
jgi:SAM-dependent methyltransferase